MLLAFGSMSSKGQQKAEGNAAEQCCKGTREKKTGLKLISFNFLLINTGGEDLKWPLLPGRNPGWREPSLSRGFTLQRCSGYKPSAYEDSHLR